MNNVNRPFWEDNYSQLDTVQTFGAPAEELTPLIGLLPRGAKVLDLGCGEGRNALYLAQHGFDVTAVDISSAGITKLNHLAQRSGLSIATEIRDMRSYGFNSEFDLIIAHGSLHLIEREFWTPLITNIKTHTTGGGLNVLTVFTDTLPPPDDLREFHVGLFREGELFGFYDDWRILRKESYILEDEHPGNIRHRHPINKLVAQKV